MDLFFFLTNVASPSISLRVRRLSPRVGPSTDASRTHRSRWPSWGGLCRSSLSSPVCPSLFPEPPDTPGSPSRRPAAARLSVTEKQTERMSNSLQGHWMKSNEAKLKKRRRWQCYWCFGWGSQPPRRSVMDSTTACRLWSFSLTFSSPGVWLQHQVLFGLFQLLLQTLVLGSDFADSLLPVL